MLQLKLIALIVRYLKRLVAPAGELGVVFNVKT